MERGVRRLILKDCQVDQAGEVSYQALNATTTAMLNVKGRMAVLASRLLNTVYYNSNIGALRIKTSALLAIRQKGIRVSRTSLFRGLTAWTDHSWLFIHVGKISSGTILAVPKFLCFVFPLAAISCLGEFECDTIHCSDFVTCKHVFMSLNCMFVPYVVKCFCRQFLCHTITLRDVLIQVKVEWRHDFISEE